MNSTNETNNKKFSRCLIIIPAYNEGENIEELITELRVKYGIVISEFQEYPIGLSGWGRKQGIF